MKPKIYKFSTSRQGYGGNIYERYVNDAIRENFDLEVIDLSFRTKGWFRLLEFPLYILMLAYHSSFKKGFLIRNFQTSFLPLRKNGGLTIVFHIDETLSPIGSKVFQKIVEYLFFLFSRKSDPIVVISESWKKYFEGRGFTNVHLIYCPYEVENYPPDPELVASMRSRLSTGDKPLIYIGNPQPKKGADLVYEALGNKDFDLVLSGEGSLDLPLPKAKLSFDEYLALLSACDLVITFSQFLEGWCRVAHEAVLCGTPVIGSGLGGMRELLEKTNQVECKNPGELKEKVHEILRNRPQITSETQAWARSFTIGKFNQDWKELINSLAIH
ncbi:MAG: glycosyltransferase [Bdellovibrionales bacterium]|nr:glycosyltransferase [Bdellovibrionales bacterium]